MFVNIAEPRGLCQACLGCPVAEMDTEKEVDTKNHAEENDEKKETFEDLPEHLKLGTDFTMRVTYSHSSSRNSNVFLKLEFIHSFPALSTVMMRPCLQNH